MVRLVSDSASVPDCHLRIAISSWAASRGAVAGVGKRPEART